MPDVFIYQILNHYTKREDLDPGFLVLDNAANEKPDWYEYWPIRNFLLGHALDESAFYGFVSPKFRSKTNLSAQAALRFVASQDDSVDVVLLSPSIHLTAYYWNVFQFGETVHPGLLGVAEDFFRSMGAPTDLHELVTHSRNEVYSNYFIARPRFWRAWLGVTEKLYELAEAPSDPLGERLRAPTDYRGAQNVHMKIFIMERIATWLLARDGTFNGKERNPFAARSRRYKLPGAILCDALKIAFVASGRQPRYRELFAMISRVGKFLTWQVRIGLLLRVPAVRRQMQALKSYWDQAGQD